MYLLIANKMRTIIECLKLFLENEARSCSMDFGCVTPLYAYRMLGGQFLLVEIEAGLKELKKQGAFCL